LNFTETSRSPVLVKQEEPCHCIRCGKTFGTNASIDRIYMCGDCRVIVQSEATSDPHAGSERPKIITTEDYKQ
jgi:DNA-directed RNA polymerase subunit RPC12/RpoP